MSNTSASDDIQNLLLCMEKMPIKNIEIRRKNKRYQMKMRKINRQTAIINNADLEHFYI